MNRRTLLKLIGAAPVSVPLVAKETLGNMVATAAVSTATAGRSSGSVGNREPNHVFTTQDGRAIDSWNLIERLQENAAVNNKYTHNHVPFEFTNKKSWSPAFIHHVSLRHHRQIAAIKIAMREDRELAQRLIDITFKK